MVPGLQPLLPVLDASAEWTASAPALANLDAESEDGSTPLAFAAFVPDGSGSLGLSLAGSSLKQASYSLGHAAATQLRAVLRTPVVFAASDGLHDRDQVVVAAQLRDAEGHTAVELSGLSLRLALSSAGQQTSAC